METHFIVHDKADTVGHNGRRKCHARPGTHRWIMETDENIAQGVEGSARAQKRPERNQRRRHRSQIGHRRWPRRRSIGKQSLHVHNMKRKGVRWDAISFFDTAGKRARSHSQPRGDSTLISFNAQPTSRKYQKYSRFAATSPAIRRRPRTPLPTLIGTGSNPNVGLLVIGSSRAGPAHRGCIAKTGKPVAGFAIEGMATSPPSPTPPAKRANLSSGQRETAESLHRELFVSKSAAESDTPPASVLSHGRQPDRKLILRRQTCFGETSELTGAEVVCPARAKKKSAANSCKSSALQEVIERHKTSDLSEFRNPRGKHRGRLTTIGKSLGISKNRQEGKIHRCLKNLPKPPRKPASITWTRLPRRNA